MSQNKILKEGDLVRYKVQSNDLDDLGFILGQIYEVKETRLGLSISSQELPQLNLNLTNLKGELTDYADYFAKHSCPVVLPRGQSC